MLNCFRKKSKLQKALEALEITDIESQDTIHNTSEASNDDTIKVVRRMSIYQKPNILHIEPYSSAVN